MSNRLNLSTRALAALSLAALSGLALAGPERDIDVKTSHTYLSNVEEATIDKTTDAGYRMFDIEVASVNPHRYTASFVKNTGEYQSAWWWTANKTKTEFVNFYTERNARPLDIEMYRVNGEKRYAATFVPAGRSRSQQWLWFENVTFNDMLSLADSKNMRITDLDFETVDGVRRFYGVMVLNTGQNYKNWLAFSNISSNEIKQLMSERNLRLVDIERISDSSFAGVMQEKEGNPQWYFTNRSWEDVKWLQEQYGTRIMDIERHVVSGEAKFNILLMNNNNALEWRIGEMLRDNSDGTRGFILKEVNGQTRGALMDEFRTYPASTIKVLEHYYWSRRVGNGFLSQTPVPLYTNHQADTHDNTDIAKWQSLQATMQQMMWPSSNQDANALQEFAGNGNGATGRDNINSFATNILGLNPDDIYLHHKFADGNIANDPYNIMTMRTISGLYEDFANSVGLTQLGWDFFHDNMLNESGTGGTAFRNGVRTVIQQEGAKVGMSLAECNAVFAQVQLCWKAGNVTGYQSAAGWISLPHWKLNMVDRKEFTVAVFQDDFTVSTLGGLSSVVMPEILREEIALMMNTWK